MRFLPGLKAGGFHAPSLMSEKRAWMTTIPARGLPGSHTTIAFRDYPDGTREVAAAMTKDGRETAAFSSHYRTPGNPEAPGWERTWERLEKFITGQNLSAYDMNAVSSSLITLNAIARLPVPAPASWWDASALAGGAPLEAALRFFAIPEPRPEDGALAEARACAALMRALRHMAGKTITITKRRDDPATRTKAEAGPMRKTDDEARTCHACRARAEGLNSAICMLRPLSPDKNRILHPDTTTCDAWEKK